MARSVGSGSRRWTLAAGVIAAMAWAALGPGSGVVLAASPAVHWGAKAGPVPVHGGTYRTVAALSLPAGNWWVTAKGVLEAAGGLGSEHYGAACRLVLGSHQDLIAAAPTANGVDGSRTPFLLTAAHRFVSGGKAKLNCVAETGTGSVVARDIRIVATRAGRLTVTASGASSTTGSGTPRVIALQDPGTVTGYNDADYHSIGMFGIPAGRWWIVAKTTLRNPANGPIQCRLRTSWAMDYKQVGVSMTGFSADQVPVALQVVHSSATAEDATLECQSFSEWTATAVAFAAIKVGTLTNRALDAGTSWIGGSGTPVVISGWADAPREIARGSAWKTVRSLALPAGRWSLAATLWTHDALPSGLARRVDCRLRFGSDIDATQVRQNNNVTKDAVMMLTLTHVSGAPGSAKLQCRRTGAVGSVTANWIKITAIRATTLVKKPI